MSNTITINLPPQLRGTEGGKDSITLNTEAGADYRLRDCLDSLSAESKARIYDSPLPGVHQQLRRHLLCYVNGADSREAIPGLDQIVKPGDEISLIAAAAGG